MNLDNEIVIPSTVFAQVLDDEIVILDTQSENYFGLDSVGAVMWQELQKNPSLAILKVTMLAMYDVDEKILENDIKLFIDKLEKNKLITIGQI